MGEFLLLVLPANYRVLLSLVVILPSHPAPQNQLLSILRPHLNVVLGFDPISIRYDLQSPRSNLLILTAFVQDSVDLDDGFEFGEGDVPDRSNH